MMMMKSRNVSSHVKPFFEDRWREGSQGANFHRSSAETNDVMVVVSGWATRLFGAKRGRKSPPGQSSALASLATRIVAYVHGSISVKCQFHDYHPCAGRPCIFVSREGRVQSNLQLDASCPAHPTTHSVGVTRERHCNQDKVGQFSLQIDAVVL